MTIASSVALFTAMLILALIPGPGVFAVVARSMASGFRSGAVTAFGIVFGDYVYIILSVFGLVALANVMGSFFVLLKYFGAAYLLWLAVSLWRASTSAQPTEGINELSLISNFLAGLITTLGNPKAILFYVGFFPTFLDLSAVSLFDVALIMVITTVAMGGVMLCYAYAASRSRQLLSGEKAAKRINRTASCVMAGSSILLATRA